MLTKRLFLFSALVGSLAASAHAATLRLTTGAPARDGLAQFRLVAQDGSEQPVRAEIRGGESAAQKAQRIRGAVAALQPPGRWRAQGGAGSAVTFEHFQGGQWTEIENLREVNDDSDGPAAFEAPDSGLQFDFKIEPGPPASGVAHGGGSSSITFVITSSDGGTTVQTQVIPAGTSAESVIARLIASLQADGFSVSRTSATGLRIVLDGHRATVVWRITDTALLPRTATDVFTLSGTPIKL